MTLLTDAIVPTPTSDNSASPAKAARNSSDITRPAVIILIAVALLASCVTLFQIHEFKDLYPVEKRYPGNDYRFFYHASLLIRAGNSPYQEYYYTSPPTAAYLNLPLSFLSFSSAYECLMALSLAGTGAALLVVTAGYFRDPSTRWMIFFCGLATLALGSPLQFLLDRGNTDALVLAFVALGIMTCQRHGFLGGLLIGFAVAVKIYPVLLVFPLLLRRRWTILAGIAVAIAALALATAPDWPGFLDRLMTREEEFRIDENVSFASFLVHAARVLALPLGATPISAFTLAGTCLFALLLGLTLLTDLKSASTGKLATTLLLYVPLMVSFPKLAFSYELVQVAVLIPLTCWLWATSRSPRTRPFLLLLAIGIVLSQVHASPLTKLSGSVTFHFLPALGVFLMVIAALGCKCTLPGGPFSFSFAREIQ